MAVCHIQTYRDTLRVDALNQKVITKLGKLAGDEFLKFGTPIFGFII